MSDPPQQHSDETKRRVTHFVYGAPERGLNQIREVTCDSWNDFAAKVRVTHNPMVGRVFRGQCEWDWLLRSKWDRYAAQKNKIANGMEAAEGRRETPETLLAQFKEQDVGTSGFDISSLTDEECLAFGRHHGLTTQLLDWTHSPYIAAFFAFRDLLPVDDELGCLDPQIRANETGSVAVWQIPLTSSCNRLDHFKFVTADHNFALRQRAQLGLFTLVDPPKPESADDYLGSVDEYLESEGCKHCLTRYKIPKRDVVFAMQDLTLMNITESTMFPDADGAARQANLGGSFDWAALLEHMARQGE